MHRFNNALPEDDERRDGKAECHECLCLNKPDDMALLAGKYFCSTCFDPQQKAFDTIVAMIEHMEASLVKLTIATRDLRNQLLMKEKRTA